MKLSVPKMELKVLKTITKSRDSKIIGLLSSGIDESFFHYPPAKQSFQRISALMRSKAEIPTWDELINDPIIAEDNRKVLNNFKKAIIKDKISAKKALTVLDKYRVCREAAFHAQDTLKALSSKETLDLDKLIDSFSETSTKMRLKSNKDDFFFHVGAGNNTSKLAKDVLNGKGSIYIPTGFKAYDNTNRGIALGSLMLLAATTSSGKSTLSFQLSHNMVKYDKLILSGETSPTGVKIANVMLEMDEKETMQRHLAFISKTSMSNMLDPKSSLTKEQRQRIYKQYEKYQLKLAERGAVETYIVPPEDMTIEEILGMLKPYGYHVIIIDYVGLLKGLKGEDQWRLMTAATRYAKIWAKNNNTAVILCAQLTESDMTLRQSKAMKDDANNMWRWHYTPGSNIIQIEQDKARQQKRFPFHLYMDFEFMTVRDLTEDEISSVANNNNKIDNKDVKKSKFAGQNTLKT